MTSQKIIAIIGARGGSKGVPGKNIRTMIDRPLIAYAIEAANANKDMLYRTIVSTDDEKIAKIAKELHADVPFIRPAELATDTSPSIDFIKHAVDYVEKKDNVIFDWILLIQPTNPFVLSKDIETIINMSAQADKNITAFVSVAPVNDHPLKTFTRDEQGTLKPYVTDSKHKALRRQDLTNCYKRNGSLYLLRRDIVMQDNELYGNHVSSYLMPAERSIDIDTEFDWDIAEFMLRKTLKTLDV